MAAPEKVQRRQSRSATLDVEELEHVAVGDLDPTSCHSADHQHPLCQVEWVDALSPTFVVLWICTREPSHHGQHIAGTGHWVAAVHQA